VKVGFFVFDGEDELVEVTLFLGGEFDGCLQSLLLSLVYLYPRFEVREEVPVVADRTLLTAPLLLLHAARNHRLHLRLQLTAVAAEAEVRAVVLRFAHHLQTLLRLQIVRQLPQHSALLRLFGGREHSFDGFGDPRLGLGVPLFEDVGAPEPRFFDLGEGLQHTFPELLRFVSLLLAVPFSLPLPLPLPFFLSLSVGLLRHFLLRRLSVLPFVRYVVQYLMCENFVIVEHFFL
jgi:hypothetical protein